MILFTDVTLPDCRAVPSLRPPLAWWRYSGWLLNPTETSVFEHVGGLLISRALGYHFFRVSDLVICGLLVWSDSVRTAAAVVIVYRYRFTAVDERVRASSPLFFCVFFRFVCVLFLGGRDR